MTSIIRQLAIRLNGAPQSVPENIPTHRPAAIAQAICMPSTGGLSNPQFKYLSGCDLRASLGFAVKKSGKQ